MVFARLRSVEIFSAETCVPRVGLSLDGTVSWSTASYHRGKHVRLIINRIFFSNVSRVLSTNKYKEDFSSCKFYAEKKKNTRKDQNEW